MPAMPLLILLVGLLVVIGILTRAGLERLRVPPLVGFLALGYLLRVANQPLHLFGDEGQQLIEFLATLGVIVLLFRVGLESNIEGMLKQLRTASLIWIGDVTASASLGYVTARYVLSLELIPSLVVATALTATSVGIPAQVWRDSNALGSEHGERFLDVAELDDISGVVFMALLFALLPLLQDPGGGGLLAVAGETAGVLTKLVSFTILCLLFSGYGAGRLMRLLKRLQPEPHPMLGLAGVGFMVAAMAALMGFSVAIGAFFAGLVFSRDPRAVREDASFSALYELFSPFFFIGIGFHLLPQSLFGAVGIGLVLLAAAVAGKLIGVTIGGKLIGTLRPVRLALSWTGALVLGVSMLPRAEIAMLIMRRGSALGDWAVPPSIYAAMVLVSAATCIGGPLLLRPLLARISRRGDHA
jgi:Kef-type K+ transport system membrane component KefB